MTRYGLTGTVEIAHRLCLWYRSFAGQTVHLVMVRAPRKLGFEIALLTTDLDASPDRIVERYASRWSIEGAFEEAKQVTGVGEDSNRKELAVRRTVPFGLFCRSLLTVWYATSLHADTLVADCRRRAPGTGPSRAPPPPACWPPPAASSSPLSFRRLGLVRLPRQKFLKSSVHGLWPPTDSRNSSS